jgi:hypothetical protein
MWITSQLNWLATVLLGLLYNIKNKIMSYEKKDKIVSVTRAQLITLRNANKLIPSWIYYINDREVYLEALESNVISFIGKRLMRVPLTTYYTPQTVSGIFTENYQGIYGQAITAGSTPNSGSLIGATIYYAIWGGRLWQRNTSGADGTPPNNFQLNSTGWTLVPLTDSRYETLYFDVKYNLSTDSYREQSDWKGNIIKNTVVSGFNTVTHTDWNNDLIVNNICNGIYNNWRSNTQRAEISLNICDGQIFSNNIRNISGNKILGDIRNNTSGPSADILRNICQEIHSNQIGGSINDNRLGGGIFSNTNNGNILQNIITTSINSNSNSGVINNNRCFQIFSNSSNTGTNMGITNNRNNGSILRNNSTANINIQNNINNGDIGNSLTTTNRATTIQDTVVNK